MNVDHQPRSKEVISCDIRARLPFGENVFDGVYSSHVIEHLEKDAALSVLREIYRVLKAGCICRIVVPDYQDCAAEYLRVLERAMKGEKSADRDYSWIVIEMTDQLTRSTYGGEMARYIASAPPNIGYVESRVGAIKASSASFESANSLFKRFVNAGLPRVIEKSRITIAQVVVRLICGKQYEEIVRESVFRASGELHRSIWDQYSLQQWLAAAGFSDVRRCSAFESEIEGFDQSGLDFLKNSKTVFRPHSLYMEARKK